MKKLFLLAWPIALAAVSCSNEEVVSVNNDANEIKFTAVAENATRASADEMFCNNNKPTKFNVWALSNQTVDANTVHNSYFEGVEYSLSGGKWVATDQNNVRFWPNQNAATLDFYAMHNYNGATVQWKADATGSNPRLGVTGYVLTTTLADQKDFIYSVKTGQSKPGTTLEPNKGDITLNFRHALSQVVFQARNTNNSLHIEIGAVQVKNFNSKGDFYLPVATTEDNKEDHTAKPSATPDAATVGTWKNLDVLANTSVNVYKTTEEGQAEAEYAVVKYSTTAHDGTNLTNAGDRDFEKAMLFIPQTRTQAAVPTGTNAVKDDNDNPYFVITCKIWNVNGAKFDKTKDVCIYNGDTYIPVTATWEAGKKYIYTFVFGGKNGGYDPDGKDVLVPISFDITVDDFTPVVEKEENMFQ